MSELKVDKVSPRTGNYVALNTVGSKNIIINGDMSIAQRGTSFTGLGNGDNETYTLDRFAFAESGAPTGECTISQDSDVPSGQGFAKSLKVDITTADAAIAAGDLFYINTKFEGQNLQYLKYGTSNAESLTLSFWVKSNVTTGNFAVSFYNQDPSTTRIVNLTYSINSANTWEKKTFTIGGETTSGNGFTNSNGRSLWLNWIFAAGTDWTSGIQSDSWHNYTGAGTGNWAAGQTANLLSSISNELYITGVQLEAGTTASDFEFLPVDVNYTRCNRYYQDYTESNTLIRGYGYNTTSGMDTPFTFKTPMRAAPTMTEVTGGDGGSSTTLTSFGNIKTYGCDFNTDPTTSNQINFYAFTFTADAEL